MSWQDELSFLRQATADTGPPRQTGRRTLHYKHLESGFTIGHFIPESNARSRVPEFKQRSMSPTAQAILQNGFPEAQQLAARKRHLDGAAHRCSFAGGTMEVRSETPRYTKRQLIKPEEALAPDFTNRFAEAQHPGSKRICITPQRTGRVLDTREEAFYSRPGLRCQRPPDTMTQTFMAYDSTALARGRKILPVPQTLSFQE